VKLAGRKLAGIRLPGADLRDADLSKADLSGGDLSGADLRGANLDHANVNGTNLDRAKILNTYAVRFTGVRLAGYHGKPAWQDPLSDHRGVGMLWAPLAAASAAPLKVPQALAPRTPAEAPTVLQFEIGGRPMACPWCGGDAFAVDAPIDAPRWRADTDGVLTCVGCQRTGRLKPRPAER
jgi:uncharacterized protein YjbI with pentapeptide repeats